MNGGDLAGKGRNIEQGTSNIECRSISDLELDLGGDVKLGCRGVPGDVGCKERCCNFMIHQSIFLVRYSFGYTDKRIAT